MIILEYIEFLVVPGAPHLIPVNYLITPAAEQKIVFLRCLSGTPPHCFYLSFSSSAYLKLAGRLSERQREQTDGQRM